MSVTYRQIEREVHQQLANIAGGTVTDVETNYAAASSVTNRLNPDFAYTPVQDAIFDTIADIIRTIAWNPRYHEWRDFSTSVSSLAYGANIPQTNSLGTEYLIGVIGSVTDQTNGEPLALMPLDKIRDFHKYSSTVYSSLDVYWYALNGQKIFHTRTNVTVFFCVYTRGTPAMTDPIILRDHHAPRIVDGAVARMARTEAQYMPLYESANASFQAHLENIRSYVDSADTQRAVVPSEI